MSFFLLKVVGPLLLKIILEERRLLKTLNPTSKKMRFETFCPSFFKVFCRCPVKKKRGFFGRIPKGSIVVRNNFTWVGEWMNDFTQSGKKRVLSSSTKFELFFFSSIVAFCRHFCRLYARALVSKEEEERSPSFFFSLSLSHSFPRFAPPRRREKRRRPFERRRRKRRRRGVACFRFGERRYATPIGFLVFTRFSF